MSDFEAREEILDPQGEEFNGFGKHLMQARYLHIQMNMHIHTCNTYTNEYAFMHRQMLIVGEMQIGLYRRHSEPMARIVSALQKSQNPWKLDLKLYVQRDKPKFFP
jgi:hypothetical protein